VEAFDACEAEARLLNKCVQLVHYVRLDVHRHCLVAHDLLVELKAADPHQGAPDGGALDLYWLPKHLHFAERQGHLSYVLDQVSLLLRLLPLRLIRVNGEDIPLQHMLYLADYLAVSESNELEFDLPAWLCFQNQWLGGHLPQLFGVQYGSVAH